jgi:hypothetical protein
MAPLDGPAQAIAQHAHAGAPEEHRQTRADEGVARAILVGFRRRTPGSAQRALM